MTAESVVAAAQAALAAGDAAGFAALMAPEIVFTVQGTTAISGRMVGPAAILDWFARIAPRIASASTEPVQVLAAGDWVLTRDRVTALTVAGRTYRNDYARLWHVVDGRCVELIEYLDTEAVTRDLLAE